MTQNDVEKRLTDLELAVLDLTKMVEDLNAELILLSKKNARLEVLCNALKDAVDTNMVRPLSEETRPPHY